MLTVFSLVALLPLLAAAADGDDYAQNFTINNGQIYTPGLAILNAPQPGTPLGGENLHVSLDVTTNGEIPLPPYADDSPSGIFNITMFLSSYVTGRNFTISNGTATENNHTLGPIMLQEPGSTVKHVNWLFPRCLVGDGQPSGDDSDRGLYNISIRQNFRLNGEDHYTIFDVPVRLTNRIEERDDRPDCDALDNPLLSPEELDVNGANAVGIFAAPGGSTEIEVKPASEDGNGNDNDNDNGDFGELKPDARPGDGLGAAGALSWRSGASWLSVAAIGCALAM
ncbi:hypothetical protein VD0002_g977 [Verticillium dahliae]|uniref:Uncharacterized protein n=2 Tax=Verticillium dahliae TaxID=27337 RepID=G2X2W1_VERDV|nr:uncharacterized protein VDAG_04155 [Verticillium dahliae VdLs.17]KAF3346449.1 Lactoylglutathione lyase [Verticillium dahliae VDG2]KAH6700500.1 hypothetical protein EV126DRAFT_512208 [Verticillium dahliae]EGY22717.1 hypothetical protein VDAG_04155 [Verticillium dahliae VdLs.17]PNH34590.1 hypothetical protein BJF96_g2029 [Verticillium dahliae]PNH55668.1 hypothetical protein VD0003_g1988 [Verticillium dahliae]